MKAASCQSPHLYRCPPKTLASCHHTFFLGAMMQRHNFAKQLIKMIVNLLGFFADMIGVGNACKSTASKASKYLYNESSGTWVLFARLSLTYYCR